MFNCLSDKFYFCFIICFVIIWYFLVLLIEGGSSAFSLYLYISGSMNLEEAVVYYGLEGLLLCKSVPVAYVSPIVLAQGLFLVWMPTASFFRVCWPLSP